MCQDASSYVEKRLVKLLEAGVVSALVCMVKQESPALTEACRECIARYENGHESISLSHFCGLTLRIFLMNIPRQGVFGFGGTAGRQRHSGGTGWRKGRALSLACTWI